MAIAANIYLQNVAFFRRARLEASAACASNGYFVIFGMYFSFHFSHLAVISLSLSYPIITLFLSSVNCFCANLRKIVANLKKMRYTVINAYAYAFIGAGNSARKSAYGQTTETL